MAHSDQQTIKSQSQDVVLEEASKYEYVVTLEKTEKVRDMYSADATSQGGDRQPTSYIDRTVTWTIGSNSPIDHGVFLDNSPWVVDNGDIHLLATTPEEENNMYGEIVFNGEVGDFDAGWDFNLDNPVTKNYRINSTVINPDFGYLRRFDHDGRTGKMPYYSAPNSRHYEPNTNFRVIEFETGNYDPEEVEGPDDIPNDRNGKNVNPFDARSGFYYSGSNFTKPETVGNYYWPQQRWERDAEVEPLLKAGDTVFVYRSLNLPLETESMWKSWETYVRNGDSNDGKHFYWGLAHHPNTSADYPTVEQICILNVLQSAPPQNAFRPPANWSGSDKPIFTLEDDLSSGLIDYNDTENPMLQFFSDSAPTFLSNQEYNSYTVSEDNTPSDSWTIAKDAYDASDSAIGLVYHGTITQQRQYFPLSQTSRGYGGYESNRLDHLQVQCWDSRLSADHRRKATIRCAQHGVDSYGLWRSTFRFDSHTGYHGGQFTPALLFAWMVCGKPQEMFDVLNGDNYGREETGNFVTRDNWDVSDIQWPSYIFHEGEQRVPLEVRGDLSSEVFPDNLQYVYEKPFSVELEAGRMFTKSSPEDGPTDRFFTYDQMIEVVTPTINSEPDNEYFRNHKNYQTFRSTNKHPIWGAHDNTYDFKPYLFTGGLLIKGPNGVGRIIGVQVQGVKDGELLDEFFDGLNISTTKKYEIRWEDMRDLRPNVRFFIQGTPFSDVDQPFSLHYATEREIAEENLFHCRTTGWFKSTPARAIRHAYHYSVLSYTLPIGLMAKHVGEDNLPEIGKIMYSTSKQCLTSPIDMFSGFLQPGYSPLASAGLPQNEYADLTIEEKDRPAPVKDSYFSSIARYLYGRKESDKGKIIHPGRKELWPELEINPEFVTDARTWSATKDDIDAVFTAGSNSNATGTYYDRNGNRIYDGGQYADLRNHFPTIFASNIGDSENAPDPVEIPFVDGQEIYQYLRIQSNGNIPWSVFEDKYLYMFVIGSVDPMRLKLISNPVNVEGNPANSGHSGLRGNPDGPGSTAWTSFFARVDGNNNFMPYLFNDLGNYPERGINSPVNYVLTNRACVPLDVVEGLNDVSP